MRIDAIRQEGYDLLHHGVIALAQVESNGIRIDVKRLTKTREMLEGKIRDLKHSMEADGIWKVWRRRFGDKANMTSGDQLGEILHVELNYEVINETESGRPSTDAETLQHFDNPFLRQWSQLVDYRFALNTSLRGIERELVGDRLHPVFNLHMAQTYRSSSDSPNFQNFPVRNKEIAEIIRSLFIASPGCVLPENDFKGIEVAVSACYHKDENFISYLKDPTKDMHRDMAAQIYFLDPKDVSKDTRYGAKNKFVFPEFYGDFYISCAKALWEWIDKGKLTGPEGIPLKKHLKRNGITKLGKCDPDESPEPGTFEAHLQEVENDFWNHRFMQYGQWRKDWYKAYLKKGYFDLLTGFRVFGSFRRNQVVNYPVQGSAFHCLLWTLIRANRLLTRYHMRSKLVGQIHDSMLGDVPEGELRDYWEILEQIVQVDLRKHYPWLNVPLEIEFEIPSPGGNWFQKKEIKFKGGRFLHPTKPDKFTSDPAKFLKMIGTQ